MYEKTETMRSKVRVHIRVEHSKTHRIRWAVELQNCSVVIIWNAQQKYKQSEGR